MRNKIKITIICALSLFLSSCLSPEEKTVRQIMSDLRSYRFWETTYEAEICGYEFVCRESTSFDKEGVYVQRCAFYLPDQEQCMFTIVERGKYTIEYDNSLQSYFLNQELIGNPSIENFNTNEEYFKKFEVEMRLRSHGDAYDMVEDENDKTLYGLEIIECTRSCLLLKDLSDSEAYDFIPTNSDNFPKQSEVYNAQGNRVI